MPIVVMRILCCLCAGLLALSGLPVPGNPGRLLAAETGIAPERLAAWTTAAQELQQQVQALTDDPLTRTRQADAAVCAKAVTWIVKHREFYKPNYADKTDKVLALGQQRLAELQAGKASWLGQPGKTTVYGYVSSLDNSVQPFAVTLPADFDPQAQHRWPLHLVLHGRADTMNEVSFIDQHEGKAANPDLAWIQLDVFGRTNNAYRWAGEVDVFEALAATRRLFPIDERRITLWGFSMGGAGAWHLGLHYPDKWSSVGAGAGFADTVEYLNLKEPLSPLSQKLIRIYDAVDYAPNAADVPIIGYGGELDKQLRAGQRVQAAAKAASVEIPLLIGPQTEHKFHPDSLREFMGFHAKATEQGRAPYPGLKKIRFVTYTPKYNSCEWLTIEEQIEPYAESVVEAQRDDAADVVQVTTKNVGVLSLARDIAATAVIDGGRPLPLLSAADGLLPNVYFERTADGWQGFDYRTSHEYLINPGRSKRRHLQGPIDDAFMRSFVCVRGTGTPWSEELADYAAWSLDRFAREYDKFLRAELPVINDTQVTEELLETHNIVVFGDPGSNSLLARVIDRLPLAWTREAIEFRGERYSTTDHVVPLVYPNPLNPHRYLVVNSGHTFHAAEFTASNANLYPKLGDAAVIQFRRENDHTYRESVLWSGIFDVQWNLK